MKALSILVAAALFGTAFGTASCRQNEFSVFEAGVVERFDFFSLDIGHMENQLALFVFDDNPRAGRASVALRDGMLYITDSNGGKIVRYNFFGDLLFMIFNEETNPRPISLSTNFEAGEHAARWATHHPLREPGRIVLNSNRHIFVEERLPYDRVGFDPESGVVLDTMILHFDQNGNFIQYLSQNGPGGRPFPPIVGLYTSAADEIVVVSRLPEGWNIFWFDSSGMLLYLVIINSGDIPVPPGMAAAVASVDKIVAAPDVRRLLIKVDYHSDIFDENNARVGKELSRSVVWTLNVENGTYIGYTEVPLRVVADSSGESAGRMVYSMLGVMPNGIVLLYFPVDAGHSIMFLNTFTGEARRGVMNFSSRQLVYNNFSLSPDGMLLGILVDDYQVNVVSWRTDMFLMREAFYE